MAIPTSRSQFLGKMLNYYEAGDAQGMLDYAYEIIESTTLDEIDDNLSENDNHILNKLNAKILEARGNALVANRLTVAKHSQLDLTDIFIDHIKQLSPERQQSMIKAILDPSQSSSDNKQADPEDRASDALDARYARELIELLPSIVAKASLLDEISIARIPKQSVERYFREAHDCYFYGLKRACAVLCRAILEAALKEILGPNHRTNELLDVAAQTVQDGKPILDAERIQAADRIFSAGDAAVHHEHIFDRNYPDAAVERLLLDMRKILEDLYSRSQEASA